MIIKDLLEKYHSNIEEITNYFFKDLTEDIMLEFENTKENYELLKNKLINVLDEMCHLEPIKKDLNDIVFVVEQKETIFHENNSYLHIFYCKKNEILEKAKDDFTLWNDKGNRIEHYTYSCLSREEILGMEVYIDKNIDEMQAFLGILDEMHLPLNNEQNNDWVQNIMNELEDSVKDIENQKTIPADEVFKRLRDEMFENSSNKEKEKMLAEEELKKITKERDDIYRSLVMNQNHLKCISIIQDYYIELLKSGRILNHFKEEQEFNEKFNQ